MIPLRLLVALLTAGPGAPSGPAPVHDIHLSYARMAVEGNVVHCRIRMFRDDLERALSLRAGRPVTLSATAPVDSLFTAYFNEHFLVMHEGRRLAGTVVASGEEPEMWWYTVRFDAPAPIRRLAIRNGVLFDLFDDQRNITKVMHVGTDAEFSYFFVKGDRQPQTMRFQRRVSRRRRRSTVPRAGSADRVGSAPSPPACPRRRPRSTPQESPA